MSEDETHKDGIAGLMLPVLVILGVSVALMLTFVNNAQVVNALKENGQETTATYESKRTVKTGKYSRGYAFTYKFHVNDKPYTVDERGNIVPKGTQKTVCYDTTNPERARIEFEDCGKNK